MTAALHIRSTAVLATLCIALLTSGCKKNDAAPVPRPEAAVAAPLDNTGHYCLKRSDCPGQWDAFQQKAAQVDAQTALSNHIKGLPHADPNLPDGQYVQLDSGYQLATLLYALSGMPPDYEALAAAASEEYRTNADQFRKRDLMQALRPKIDQKIATYRAVENRYFTMTNATGAAVQHYDFKTSSFPIVLGLRPGNYIYFNDAQQYKLGYNNGNDFLALKVSDEQRAKEMETLVSKGELQYCEYICYLFIQEADTANNEVKAQVVRVVLKDRLKHNEVARF